MWLTFATMLLTAMPSPSTLSADNPQITDQTTAETSIFPVDPALEPRIKFWEYIWGELPSGTYLLHDTHFPEITYYTVVLEPIADESPIAKRKRAKEFCEEQKKILADIMQKYLAGDEDALKQLPNSAGAARIAELKEKYPSQMATAASRIGIQHGVADLMASALPVCEKQYRSDIEEILRRNGVPEELYWLVFVESMCTPYSGSHAGALGIWQLMPGTARDFNLVVNKQRDDRVDVGKSTAAAAKLMKRGQKMLKDWPLVITGYNHGPAGVLRLTEKYHSTDLAYLIENINYREESNFGFASKNFYSEFIAVQRVGKALLKRNEVSHD